ncbi:glutamate--tRNA ligase [Pelagibius marinus]|uniref:glutamate--tRNA ligase n=1 Tax=Pelagibius marinus TaxID=2762760 RepID=UPI001873382B|nr:glutamate--tRNA ligase [Pelagibius marinus]
MTLKVRFAPSPTGLLHVGNARQALINWLFARAQGGRYLLRIDDTDTERSTPEFAQAIEDDLRWLGLTWDEKAVQSERLERYSAAAERLKAAGRLYACYETPEELGLKRKVALAAGRPPIYDRGALNLSDEDRAKLEAEGRRPHWRFKLEPGEIAWDDLVRGPVSFQGENLSDPVLIREDARPLYTLTSVVDDIELEVTHVLRGEDHVANTAVQVQLFQALGGPGEARVPAFGHLSLIAGAGGESLSKRLGSLSLASLRESGLEAMTLNCYLARLGTPDPVEPLPDLAALAQGFDLSRFGRATPKFDPAELEHLNARLLHVTPFEAVADRLPQGFDADLWAAIRPNLTRLAEAAVWQNICRGPVIPQIEDAGFARQAAELLPPEPWDETTWSAWTGAVKAATGRKGKALFLPLRLALTGLDHGPELKALLPLIGRERAEARLLGKTA